MSENTKLVNTLQIFSFNNREVRVVMKNDEPWWVAKDVCDVLDIQNVTQALERLDEDERSMFFIGRQGEANVINESGLYALIFRSNKPEARKFRKWVTHDVLPSLRRNGAYVTGQEKDTNGIRTLLSIVSKLEERIAERALRSPPSSDLESRWRTVDVRGSVCQEPIGGLQRFRQRRNIQQYQRLLPIQDLQRIILETNVLKLSADSLLQPFY